MTRGIINVFATSARPIMAKEFDRIFDTVGAGYINGGFGQDVVYGRGTIIGGQGNDTVWVISGTGYGDNPDVSSAAGNDILEANLTDAPNESKALVGGRGADEFRIILAQEDNQISTRAHPRLQRR